MDRRVRPLVAEFLGTFALVFFGAGSICADAMLRGKLTFGAADLLMVAAAHAIALAVMVTAVGHISGAHFNPAVTIAAAMGRHIEASLAAAYIAVQLAAGVVAALLLKAFFPDAITAAVKLGAPTLGTGVSAAQGFFIEVVLTFFLVTVVFATAIDPRGAFDKVAGFGIGLVLIFDILVGGPLTGAAMNPARAFGPAAVGGALDATHFLAYWIAPIVGAILAGLLYDRVLIHESPVTDVPPPSEENIRR